MGGTAGFQEALFNEMKGRIKETDESVPTFKKRLLLLYANRRRKQYYKYCRKGSLEASEEILLDVDKMAEGHSYYAVGGISIQ